MLHFIGVSANIFSSQIGLFGCWVPPWNPGYNEVTSIATDILHYYAWQGYPVKQQEKLYYATQEKVYFANEKDCILWKEKDCYLQKEKNCNLRNKQNYILGHKKM